MAGLKKSMGATQTETIMHSVLRSADDAPAAGHNSISDDDKRVLFFMRRNDYVAALAKKKEADALLKNVGKKVKADLGDNGLRQIKLYEELRTPEGEAKFKAQRAADAQAAAWAGLPVNTQVDMFADLAPLDERAFSDGEEAGLRGDTLDNPYEVNSLHGRQFEAGWQSGQAKLFEGIKKQDAATAPEHILGSTDPEFPDEDEGERVAAE